MITVHGIILTEDFGLCKVEVVGIDASPLIGAPVTSVVRAAFPVGSVTDVRTILTSADCHTDGDRGLLDSNQGKPFIRATGLLQDDCIYGLEARVLGWSGFGSCYERQGDRVIKGVIRGLYLDIAGRNAYRIYRGVG